MACFFLVLVSGCYYDNEEELYPIQAQCITDSLTYNEQIKPIIDTRCATSGCHVAGGTGTGIFTDYAAVKAKADNGTLRDRVIERKGTSLSMPPQTHPQLTECQIQQFDIWIAAGALEN